MGVLGTGLIRKSAEKAVTTRYKHKTPGDPGVLRSVRSLEAVFAGFLVETVQDPPAISFDELVHFLDELAISVDGLPGVYLEKCP